MRKITWDEVMENVDKLAFATRLFKYVYGVPRGGAIVALLLSYHHCTLITDWRELNDPTLKKQIIIVDDIADSGTTLTSFAAVGYATASLFMRYNCAYQPKHAMSIIETDEYILLPYETHSEGVQHEKTQNYRNNTASVVTENLTKLKEIGTAKNEN